MKPQRKALFGLIFCVMLGAIFSSSGAAQSSTTNNQITGYGGSVSILPNAARSETTIVLTMNYISNNTKSNQIVFHVQGTSSNVPPLWSGSARVLVGDGVLAILPKGQSHNILFKFPEVQTPASLSQIDFDEYPTYGIARFGKISRSLQRR